MIITSTVTRDNGLLDRIRSTARNFTSKVEVGYLNGAMHKPSITSGSPNPITMSSLAAIHELGLGVPKRAFIEPALQQNRNKYIKYAGRQITPIIRRRQSFNNAWQELNDQQRIKIRKIIKLSLSNRFGFNELVE